MAIHLQTKSRQPDKPPALLFVLDNVLSEIPNETELQVGSVKLQAEAVLTEKGF